jgi:hypothetical protein
MPLLVRRPRSSRPGSRRNGPIARRTLAAVCTALTSAVLVPAAAAAQAPSGFTMTDFDPERHSFRFVNNWNTGDLTADLPLVGSVSFKGIEYGLCGGMSFAALDSFNADRTVPTGQTTEPREGSALRDYIWARQIDSLTVSAAAALVRFLDWQWKPLDDQYFLGVRVQKGLKTLTREEFVFEIQPRLKRGGPVALGMVNVSGFAEPWGNHQVLAIGYRARGNGHASIAVYDPNFPISAGNPDGITFLHTSNRRQTLGASPSSSRAHNGRFRGLFRAPYEKKTPPWTNPTKIRPTIVKPQVAPKRGRIVT